MVNPSDWNLLVIVPMVGLAAFICGVALFYLVMNRTRKHRSLTANSEAQDS